MRGDMKFDMMSLKTLLQKAKKPSLELLKALGWECSLIPDYLNEQEVENIHIALKANKTLIIISYEATGVLDTEEIVNSKEAIMDVLFEKSHCHICMTDIEVSFLIYIEQNNRFCLLCGSPKVLRLAFPNAEVTEKSNYDKWISNGANNSEEKKYLIDIWNTYKRT